MAHVCFSCGNECYCSGDIDDGIISKTPITCESCGCFNEIEFSQMPEGLKGICDTCNKQDDLQECFLNEEHHKNLCYDCCGKEGFCWGCGEFSGGNDAFEFSQIGHYCDNCQDQIMD